MAREYEYVVVDAFAAAPFTGNPAAVVFDAEGLTDSAMQAIAAEFNFAETAFIWPPDRRDAGLRLRWFTPAVEVSMCGHATIAAVHALAQRGDCKEMLSDPSAVLRIQTLGGVLEAGIETLNPERDERLVWLRLVSPTLTPREFNTDKLAELLRTTPDTWVRTRPTVVTQDQDLIVSIRDVQALHDLRPDIPALGAWCTRQRLRGVFVTTTATLSPAFDAQSRFFAPAAGVDEDIVTGSAHGPLGVYLLANQVVAAKDPATYIRCGQARAGGRAGFVHVFVGPALDGRHEVRIAGMCFTTMQGRLAQ